MSIRPPVTDPQLRAPARILIVGGSHELRETVVAALPPEYDILVADGTASAAATSPPHVLVLDIARPGTEGLQPLRTFRSQPSFSQTGIILLSEDARRHVVLAALHGGANDYILKPRFAADDFRRRLNQLLDRVHSGEVFPVIAHASDEATPVAAVVCAAAEASSAGDTSAVTISPQDLQAIIDSWE